jgi:DNA polymerase-1
MLSFRLRAYVPPATHKATREKLCDELRIRVSSVAWKLRAILNAYSDTDSCTPGVRARGVVIRARWPNQGVDAGNVRFVVVSGDKDFQHVVRPGVWLLNPGREGGQTSWSKWVVWFENGERATSRSRAVVVTDYLALVGDTRRITPGREGHR